MTQILFTFTVASRHFCVRIAVTRSLKPFRTCGSSLHRGGGSSTRAYFTNVRSAGTPFSCDTAVTNTQCNTSNGMTTASKPSSLRIHKYKKITLNVIICQDFLCYVFYASRVK